MELDDAYEQGKSQVKSYDCIFCKRGFTNAQALGGHMNMHRKDKAKLRLSTITDHENTPTQPCSNIRKQLLLFSDTPSSKIQNPDGNQVYWGSDNKGFLPDHDSVSSKPFHLDLELRLGVGDQKPKSL